MYVFRFNHENEPIPDDDKCDLAEMSIIFFQESKYTEYYPESTSTIFCPWIPTTYHMYVYYVGTGNVTTALFFCSPSRV